VQFYYRATLCVGAVFAVARCPSVKLVDSIQTAEDIVKLLSQPGSPIILVSDSQRRHPMVPLQRGRKIHEVRKFCDFRRCLSRKRYEIGPWLLWNVNRKLYALYRIGDIFNDLNGPLTRFSKSQLF